MAIFTQTYTNTGLTQLAATISSSYTLSRIAAGSGTQSTPSTATALASQKIASITVGAATILSPGQYVIQGTIQSNNFSGAPFVLTELGLFGSIPGVNGGAEALTMYVAVVNGPTVENNTTNPQQTIYLLFNVAVSNSANVTVTVGTGLFAIESDFVTHLADPAAHPQAFINPFNLAVPTKQGLVPANASPVDGTYALRGSNPLSWVKTLQNLSGNITLFVAAGNPNVFPNFSTIPNALTYLRDYFISTGFTATISVAAGTFTDPVVINHPQGGQISIVGTISTATATSASFSAGTVTLTGAAGAFTGYAIGDGVIVSNAQNTAGIQISGCWILTAASSTSIAYATGYGSLGTLSGVTSISVTRLRSALTLGSATAGTAMITVISGVGNIQNVLIRKTGSQSGVGVLLSNSSAGTITAVGFNGWSDAGLISSGGLATSGGSLNAASCFASRCNSGFSSQGGVIQAASCISTSNNVGFECQTRNDLTNCFAYGNVTAGFDSFVSGTTTLTGCQAAFNANGVFSRIGSIVIQNSGGSYGFNTSFDITLSIESMFIHNIGASAGIGTVSPNITAVNTLSADGCYYSP